MRARAQTQGDEGMKKKRQAITDHPHTCTKCPWHLANQPGKPFNKNAAAACLACRVNWESCGLSKGGVSWVHMDAAANPELVTMGRIAPDYSNAPSVFTFGGVSAETADWLKMLYCELSALDDFGVRIVTRLYNRVPFATTAKNLKVSRRTVRKYLRRILSASPHVRAVMKAVRAGAVTLPTGWGKISPDGILRPHKPMPEPKRKAKPEPKPEPKPPEPQRKPKPGEDELPFDFYAD